MNATSEKLRVLFVIPGESEGSSMVFARRQANALAGMDVSVECFHLRSRTSPRVLMEEAARFGRCLRRFRPALVHAHFGTVTAAFTMIAAGRTPVVITFRGSDLNRVPTADGLRACLGRMLSQWAALGAARLVCVSHDLRKRLWWRHAVTTVLPSGVDIDLFRPLARGLARRQLGWPPSEPVILFNAGHDALNKRLDLAQAAFSEARREIPGLRLEVLTGGLPPDRMPLVMNAANCLLVTSDAEGSPTVVQEALACNLPIVSVAVGDVAERLRGVAGTRIAGRYPHELARALVETVLRDEPSEGRLRCVEFSSDTIAAELARLYREIVTQRQAQKRSSWNTTLFSQRSRP
ncbi:MAG: glycosyltransferase [Acidobacteriota bacterium]